MWRCVLCVNTNVDVLQSKLMREILFFLKSLRLDRAGPVAIETGFPEMTGLFLFFLLIVVAVAVVNV